MNVERKINELEKKVERLEDIVDVLLHHASVAIDAIDFVDMQNSIREDREWIFSKGKIKRRIE